MRQKVTTEKAPAAIGPYSQGIVAAGKLVFVSGQIPLDPATGELVEGGIEQQTRQVLENLRAVLDAAGCKMSDVVKTTIFLVDLGDFAAVNSVYSEYFPADPPARSTIQVSALPKGARIEIEAVSVQE